MLVQDYLKANGGNFAKLENELGIRSCFSGIDNRVILNYNQLDSPKENPIVRECRALTPGQGYPGGGSSGVRSFL